MFKIYYGKMYVYGFNFYEFKINLKQKILMYNISSNVKIRDTSYLSHNISGFKVKKK